MSSDQGRRGTSGKGGGGSATGPAAARRLGLLVFGAAFVVLFAIVAISEGVGDPSIPSGDVAVVEGAPGDTGEVTMAEYEHAVELSGSAKPLKPGDPKFAEQMEATMNELFEAIWLQGVAAEWGIEVTDKEVSDELAKVKKEGFPTEAAFNNFIKEAGYSQADVDEKVELQVLSQRLQAQLQEKAPKPSRSEIEDYYEAAKSTQFTQLASTDIRLIVNKSRKKAEEALDALTRDNSAANWKKVASKYSEEPATKAKGGLQKAVQEGVLEEPLNAEAFAAPEGQVKGPLKTQRGYNVFQVENSQPEAAQELKAVESQIEAALAQRLEQEYLATFAANFATQWQQQTFCAPDFVNERCADFKGDGHPATASPACYEANPKGGLPKEGCPAPVAQLIPALPGTVTVLEPKGKPLAQRPRPLEEAGEAAAAPAPEEGLVPEGTAPPPAEEAPPPEEAPPAEPPAESE